MSASQAEQFHWREGPVPVQPGDWSLRCKYRHSLMFVLSGEGERPTRSVSVLTPGLARTGAWCGHLSQPGTQEDWAGQLQINLITIIITGRLCHNQGNQPSPPSPGLVLTRPVWPGEEWYIVKLADILPTEGQSLLNVPDNNWNGSSQWSAQCYSYVRCWVTLQTQSAMSSQPSTPQKTIHNAVVIHWGQDEGWLVRKLTTIMSGVAQGTIESRILHVSSWPWHLTVPRHCSWHGRWRLSWSEYSLLSVNSRVSTLINISPSVKQRLLQIIIPIFKLLHVYSWLESCEERKERER